MTPRRGPRPIADRLRRLLVILPWVMERGEVPVAEVAARFAIGEAELVRDLELVSMCGLPPFVDELIDVFIDEGTIYTGIKRVFTRPLRLTAPEGFALLAAARVAMELPGADRSGALGRALDKLEAALGGDALVVDEPAPTLTNELADAVRRCERVRLGYWSADGDRRTERTVTPRLVFVDRGNWYLIADDWSVGEQRTFRIDRIDACAPTGEFDDPREVVAPSADDWFAGTDLPVVTLELGAAGGWVVERYPTRRVVETPGGWEVDLTVAREDWLAELLLRLGPVGRVRSPDEWADLGARAAATLLAVYETAGSDAN